MSTVPVSLQKHRWDSYARVPLVDPTYLSSRVDYIRCFRAYRFNKKKIIIILYTNRNIILILNFRRFFSQLLRFILEKFVLPNYFPTETMFNCNILNDLIARNIKLLKSHFCNSKPVPGWNLLSYYQSLVSRRYCVCIGSLNQLHSIFMLSGETVFSYRHVDQYVQFIRVHLADWYLWLTDRWITATAVSTLWRKHLHVTQRSRLVPRVPRYLCHTLCQ